MIDEEVGNPKDGLFYYSLMLQVLLLVSSVILESPTVCLRSASEIATVSTLHTNRVQPCPNRKESMDPPMC